MPISTNMLRATEAAVVARVALRDVNRVIDERILPGDFFSLDGGRHVQAAACTLISFYFASARHLTSERRLFTIKEAGSRLRRFGAQALAALADEDWKVRDEFLTIDLAPFVRATTARMSRLIAARDLVVTDQDVLGCTPVIRGTRIPVHDVAASVAAGIPAERLLAAYPSLNADKIEVRHDLRGSQSGARPAAIERAASDRRHRHGGSPRSAPRPGWMKFLVDECLSPELTRRAHSRAFGQSSHVVWLGRGGAKDWELKRLILDGDWTFVTKNSVDFRGPSAAPGSKGQYADVAIHCRARLPQRAAGHGTGHADRTVRSGHG
jgi:uncharacterized protein (DUF433 family)